MIRNILVGYGGSRGAQVALSQALQIAHASTGRIRLAMVEDVSDSAAETGLVMERSSEQIALAASEERAEVEPESLGPSPALDDAAMRCQSEGVACSLVRAYGGVGERLLDLSRLADLVVVGRRGEGSRYRRSVLGRNARRLAAGAVTPTLFADREYLPVRSATLYYEPRPAGGRALAAVAEICSLLNVDLNVMCVGLGRADANAAESEARLALRAYHLDGEFVTGGQAGPEALQNAALLWGDPLLAVPTPPPGGLFPNYALLRAAMATPNTNVLLVP
jgi:nucleotide-binding universal stress UspA family protein